MKLTTRGRYAVTAILDLALHAQKGPVCLADISERQGISTSYLEQLFSKLRKQNIVQSVRGPGGGYLLCRSEMDIFVGEVIDAVDENVDATRCAGQGDCQKGETCLTHDLWQDLSLQIQSFLSQISIGNIIQKEKTRKIADRQNLAQQQRIQNLENKIGNIEELSISKSNDHSTNDLSKNNNSTTIQIAQL